MDIIDKVYKRATLNKYLAKPEITEHLQKLYKTIATPLALIETQIAVDATGISVAYGRRRWVEIRREMKLHKDYKKLHIISGAKSNIIFAAEITKGTAHDSPLLKPLLEHTRSYVKAKELSADAGYLSRKNADLVSGAGMQPFIMPKKNVRSLNLGSQGAWGKMIWLWKKHRDIFGMHYHQRSNVESTFGMLKRKFGYHTRAKSEIGQTNEILTKIVCLNATILSEAMLEFSIEPKFMEIKNE